MAVTPILQQQSNCRSDEKDITSDKLGAQIGISVVTIIYFVFILFIIGVILSTKAHAITVSKNKADSSTIQGKVAEIANYLKTITSGKITSQIKYTDSFLGRFTEWFTKVGNSINSGSVLAILAAGVVIGFNSLIMTPIISTMFPVDIAKSMPIPGRNTSMYPGQFFIALIGFIISLIIFFFVAEVIYVIRKKFSRSLTIIIIILLFLFMTFMLIWNAIEVDKLLKQPDCVPLDTKLTTFQLRNNQNLEQDVYQEDQIPIETQAPSNPPPFGIFG
jgi:hypothetical protein